MEGLVPEQSRKRSCWEGSLRLVLDTVDRVWGALQPAVPRQDVFKVAGLEFDMLKKIDPAPPVQTAGCLPES